MGRVFGIVELLPVRHPYHAGGEVFETFSAAEAGDVVGVTVGHDDESEFAAGCREEIFDSFFDRADVARAGRAFENAAIDQDITITGARWHCTQEEISKAYSIHANFEAARILSPGSACSAAVLRFGARSLRLGSLFSRSGLLCSHVRYLRVAG